MRRTLALIAIALWVGGCTQKEERGELPPPPKELTQAELDAMPPQARAAMENAKRRGAEMSKSRGIAGGQ